MDYVHKTSLSTVTSPPTASPVLPGDAAAAPGDSRDSRGLGMRGLYDPFNPKPFRGSAVEGNSFSSQRKEFWK